MASIRDRAARMMREIALWKVHPWLIGGAGLLTAAALMTFYWQAEAADRAQFARSEYRLTQVPCGDCTAPRYVLDAAAQTRRLGA